MRSGHRLRGLSVLAAAILFACGGAETRDDGSAATDSGLQTFQALDLAGETFDLADHLGRDVVMLSFWSTFCEPCKNEMPLLQRLHEQLADQGLAILSVALDGPDTVAGVRPYIRSHGYTFRVVVDEDTSIANAFNPRASMPFTVLIGRDGRIAKTAEGFQLSEAARIEQEVRQLLARP